MLKVHYSILLELCRPDPATPVRVPEREDLRAEVEEDARRCGLDLDPDPDPDQQVAPIM